MMFFAIQQFNTLQKSKLNFEQTTLNMRKMAIHERISDLQEKRDNLAAAFSSITSGVSSQAGSIFNQSISESNAITENAQRAYIQARNSGITGDELEVFKNQLAAAKEEANQSQKLAYAEYQRQGAVVASLTQAFKNVQEAELKAQEKKLNNEEAKIDTRLNAISSELTIIDKEQSSAEQASKERNEKMAPRYM